VLPVLLLGRSERFVIDVRSVAPVRQRQSEQRRERDEREGASWSGHGVTGFGCSSENPVTE
jgi:hypothetical protein